MTLQQLKYQLSAIEPDEHMYEGIEPSEIPLLAQLLNDEEPWMAARAVFALSRIRDPGALTILSQSVTDSRPEIRVALAASTSNLQPTQANDILLTLLADTELGVRKFAIKSVSETHNAVVHTKLRELANQDPVPWICDFATKRLQELNLQSS